MKLGEFLDTAKGDLLECGCGCGFGSRPQHWPDGNVLAAIHGVIRASVGGPVYVLSAARCPRHNAAVSKSERSQHSIACALDLACPPGCDFDRFHSICDKAVAQETGNRGGCGAYPAQRFVHVDTGNDEAPTRRWRG